MNPAHSLLELYLRHRTALIDYAQPIVHSRAQAEDIVQEAWLRFSRQSSTPRIDNPVAYLYRIVRNLAVDSSRRQQIENTQPDGDALLDSLPSALGQPEAITQHQDTLKRIEAGLNSLPERTRRAFLLHRVHGLRFKEIAAELSISTTLAHQLVHTALLHCMQQVNDD